MFRFWNGSPLWVCFFVKHSVTCSCPGQIWPKRQRAGDCWPATGRNYRRIGSVDNIFWTLQQVSPLKRSFSTNLLFHYSFSYFLFSFFVKGHTCSKCLDFYFTFSTPKFIFLNSCSLINQIKELSKFGKIVNCGARTDSSSTTTSAGSESTSLSGTSSSEQ